MSNNWHKYEGFSADDFDGKTVEFDIWSNGKNESGIGIIVAYQNPEGLIELEVAVDYVDGHWANRSQKRFQVGPPSIFQIEPHQNQDVAAFRLWTDNAP